MSWINYILGLLKAYPDATAVGFGILVSTCIVTLIDAVYFPTEWPFRKSQQYAIALNIVLGTGMSYGMWRFLDVEDTKWFSLWVSACSVGASPVALFMLSKGLSWKWPNLNLSFGLLRNRSNP